MYWTAIAPSNVALIKYAGKKNNTNLPLNPSFSYTLDHFTTIVRITLTGGKEDCWESFTSADCLFLKDFDSQSSREEYFPLKLSVFAVKRFLNFFQVLKKVFQVSSSFLIQSANNFPADAGAASSASSFCALTRAAHKMALSCSSNPAQVKNFTSSCLSVLSRQGSGSSCRSFFHPWALWEEEGARAVELPFSYLKHQLVLADSEIKPISSSESHKRILTSPILVGRVERAEKRLSDLLSALKTKSWKCCFEIVWDEFQDLHQLYENARPPVFYRNETSYNILDKIKTFWEREKDGPLVTMDAGSSVHLLYRPDQKKLAEHLSSLLDGYKIIGSV